MTGTTNYLLDTNIIIGFLNGNKKIIHFFNNINSNELFISQITQLELLGFPTITPKEESIINNFFQLLDILPITEPIIVEIIKLRRTTRIKLPDAIIGATAIAHQLTLVTADTQLINSLSTINCINPV